MIAARISDTRNLLYRIERNLQNADTKPYEEFIQNRSNTRTTDPNQNRQNNPGNTQRPNGGYGNNGGRGGSGNRTNGSNSTGDGLLNVISDRVESTGGNR